MNCSIPCFWVEDPIQDSFFWVVSQLVDMASETAVTRSSSFRRWETIRGF